MNRAEMVEDKILSDIAKGRYKKAKVKELIEIFMRASADEARKEMFEWCWLFACQTLHYEFGFEKDDLEKFFGESANAIDGFNAKTFTIEDIRKALKEDANFECRFDLEGEKK